MPQRWLHNLIDIITHGKYEGSYWKYHQWKDEPSRRLGKRHRVERHDDFKKIIKNLEEIGIIPKANNPYDLLMFISSSNFHKSMNVEIIDLIGFGHELIDYAWSLLTREEKIEWTKQFIDVILKPDKYFENNLLEPEDIELDEFKNLNKYIKGKKLEELI